MPEMMLRIRNPEFQRFITLFYHVPFFQGLKLGGQPTCRRTFAIAPAFRINSASSGTQASVQVAHPRAIGAEAGDIEDQGRQQHAAIRGNASNGTPGSFLNGGMVERWNHIGCKN